MIIEKVIKNHVTFKLTDLFFFSLNREEENILITSKLLENSTRKWIQLAYARCEMTHKHGFF